MTFIKDYYVTEQLDLRVFRTQKDHSYFVLKKQESKDSIEIKSLQKLKHKKIVELKDVIKNKHFLRTEIYAVLENIPWLNLRELKSRKNITEKSILKLGYNLADVLCYIHSQGFIYNDLKPDNIMMLEWCDNIKLIDFESCVSIKEDKGSYLMSTPGYSCMQLSTPFAFSNDVFSLGTVLFFGKYNESPYLKHTNDDVLKYMSNERKYLLRGPAQKFEGETKLAEMINAMIEPIHINRPIISEVKTFFEDLI